MDNVLKILKSIGEHSGRMDKENIIKANKNNKLLRDVLQFVYDPYIVVGISDKKLSKKVKGQFPIKAEELSITDIFDYLRCNKTGTGKDILFVQSWIGNQNEEDIDILNQIITKSLKIGVTAKTLNKIYGIDFIKEFNVMLAEKYYENQEKVIGEFILTTKLDGNRMVLWREGDKVNIFSRQGKPIEGLIEIEAEALQLPENIVFDGEALLKNNDKIDSKDLFQATQKIIRKKDNNKTGLIFNVFDMLPLDEFKKGISIKSCLDRKQELHNLLNELELKFIIEVPILYYGNNKEKIDEFLQIALNSKQEGIMINLANSKYQCKRTKELLKVKVMDSVDLMITGYEEGTGRNIGRLGALVVDYKGYPLKVGSGYTDAMRNKLWEQRDEVIGKIIEVQYFEQTKNEKEGLSLRFPVFLRFRNDKIEPSYF